MPSPIDRRAVLPLEMSNSHRKFLFLAAINADYREQNPRISGASAQFDAPRLPPMLQQCAGLKISNQWRRTEANSQSRRQRNTLLVTADGGNLRDDGLNPAAGRGDDKHMASGIARAPNTNAVGIDFGQGFEK